MTEYKFHRWQSGAQTAPAPSISLQAESHRHGAALALRHFVQLGCDIATPLAHVDITDSDGAKQTLLVEEILDWLSDPRQSDFVQRENLAALRQST